MLTFEYTWPYELWIQLTIPIVNESSNFAISTDKSVSIHNLP